MDTFSNFLKTEMTRNKYSQNKFAKEIGVSSYYLGQLIKGEKRPPSREIQNKIVETLNFNEIQKIEPLCSKKKKSKKKEFHGIYSYISTQQEID